tara:strand:+ start:2621 stop:3001 length:381 start_codon:yes stop_codon:yes gene_type:complete
MNTPTPTPMLTSQSTEQASVSPQMESVLPFPQPTNASIDSGSTHEGAPVQGMSSRGQGIPSYQNMSQILFNETLKACPEDSSWFDTNSTTYMNFVDSEHSNTSSNKCINDAYEEQVRLSYHYKNLK